MESRGKLYTKEVLDSGGRIRIPTIRVEEKTLLSISDMLIIKGIFYNSLYNSGLVSVQVSVKIGKNNWMIFSFRPEEFVDFVRFAFCKLYEKWRRSKEGKGARRSE